MNDEHATLAIDPETNLADLLHAFPQTENVLMQFLPSLRALANPGIRQAVAKSLTLESAAASAGASLPELIRHLRESAGLRDTANAGGGADLKNAPDWVREGTVTQTLDARPLLAQGIHPKETVRDGLSELSLGEVYLLITPFVPGPLIEVGKNLGCQTWTRQRDSGRFETYFGKVS
jgi:hypothetical protein